MLAPDEEIDARVVVESIAAEEGPSADEAACDAL